MVTTIFIFVLLIKKPIHADYSPVDGKTETNAKWPKFKNSD